MPVVSYSGSYSELKLQLQFALSCLENDDENKLVQAISFLLCIQGISSLI